MPVLLNEQHYQHKKAIRILTPLPPSGNVITLCIGYCIYFLIFHFPQSVHLSFLLSLLPCMHSIFILTLNGISSPEIRYQPGCPLLFQPRSEDSCYRAETALSPVDLMLSLHPIPLQHCLYLHSNFSLSHTHPSEAYLAPLH